MERASGATTATAADSEADDDDAMVTVFCWNPLLILLLLVCWCWMLDKVWLRVALRGRGSGKYGNDKDRGTPRYRADDERQGIPNYIHHSEIDHHINLSSI